MEAQKLQCKQCKWAGNSEEVDWDTVETCMGDDKIEICPECGSMEVYSVKPSILPNQTPAL